MLCQEGCTVWQFDAKAMSYIHCEGVCHKDLTPGFVQIEGEHRGWQTLDFYEWHLHSTNLGPSELHTPTPENSAPEVKAGETNSIGGRLFLGPYLCCAILWKIIIRLYDVQEQFESSRK
jgi:hypothetical protein